MSVHSVAGINAEPDIVLIRWRVLQTDQGSRHLAGARADIFDGRVSTAIVSFDVSERVAVTQSGRIYQLSGPPGHSEDAQYVWERWCVANNITSYEDVTSSFWSTAS
jgi:hypothetical protein